jgi:hypothetical protein
MAYSWNLVGDLPNADIICSPVVLPASDELQYKRDLVDWISRRTYPQTIETDMQPSLLGQAVIQYSVPAGVTVRCLHCGKHHVEGTSVLTTVTRSEQYSKSLRRTLFVWGVFCKDSCRLHFVNNRWWIRPNLSLVLNTLASKVKHGIHWKQSKKIGETVLVPMKLEWEKVEFYRSDVCQGFSDYDLPFDFVERWMWRQKQRSVRNGLGRTCCQCLQIFDWKAFPMVVSYEHERFNFHPTLEFCDPSCWKRHILASKSFAKDTYIPIGALYCAKKLNLTRVLAAPPRECHIDWCANGLTTKEFRDAPYNYKVIEFMTFPYVGNKIKTNDNPNLIARDIIEALKTEWYANNEHLNEVDAARVADKVRQEDGSRPRPPCRKNSKKTRSLPKHEEYQVNSSLRNFLPMEKNVL